jgi:hypothetical protein
MSMSNNNPQPAQWHKPALIVAAIFCFARGTMVPFQPDYWSPRTPLDYAAVVGTSLLLLFLAIGLWGFYLQHPATPSRAQVVWRISLAMSCLSAAMVAASNFFEDALGFKDLGIVWVYGVSVLALGLLIASISAFWVQGFPKWVGGLLLVSIVGLYLMESGGLYALGLTLLALGILKFPNLVELSPS